MNIFKNYFRTTLYIRVSNSLDPDQDQHYVGPDLGPNCFQRLSADVKVTTSKERVKPRHENSICFKPTTIFERGHMISNTM